MLLQVENLRVTIGEETEYPVLNGIDLSLEKGRVVGIIGESGSGKSMTVKSIMGLLPPNIRMTDGTVMYGGRDLAALSRDELRRYLGKDFGMVFQNPMTSLNPLKKTKDQISEVVKKHNPKLTRAEIDDKVLSLIQKVRLPEPHLTKEKYPHELSGGQKQRILIAIAIANDPKILIADEATTALDVTLQFQIISLLQDLLQGNDMSMIFISHNLGLIKHIADHVYIMYTGQIVESGPTQDIFSNPKHPYTKGLINSLPDTAVKGQPIPAIPGRVPALHEEKYLCSFYPRCAARTEACLAGPIINKQVGDNHFARCLMAE